ncbi:MULTISPECIES: response regulator transcription factor [unclassified Curtobacterium]|uniref:response regulator n=1 Tax=unclassified Curtobacterium TaxID=257496 RepID=UPI001C0B9393|nr:MULTISPECIES: response regulator transcription factor [unclassified Curtobacterium]WIB00144.1 response regulator transcription factor [Curtobacterium sp. MCBA15_012]
MLVVEDQPLLRSALVMMLRSEPDIAVVGDAHDGASAIERSDRLRPDVVLMDIRMPGIDGVEATASLTALEDGPSVILLTSYETEENIVRGLEAGASGFLAKEADRDEIVRAVRQVHAGGAVASPAATRLLLSRMRETKALRVGDDMPFPEVSPRAREVALLVADGLSNAEIARALWISEATVKTHLAAILRAYGLRTRVQIAVLAHRAGWMSGATSR